MLREDLNRIMKKAGIEDTRLIDFKFFEAAEPSVQFSCRSGAQVYMQIMSPPDERVSAFYYGVHKMGFMFPHPRQQISPDFQTIRKVCDKRFEWKPTMKYRGFHLHTQHPSEWVSAFFMGHRDIAEQTIWWLARNMQNLLQIQMLRNPVGGWGPQMQTSLQLANKLGIRVGLSVSFSMIQQKSYSLIPFWSALIYWRSKQYINKSVEELFTSLPFQILTVELGSSEFSSLGYKKTLSWIEFLDAKLRSINKTLFVKVHASTNQVDDEYGNYNFLPALSPKTVGVLPHTVHFYSLNDKVAPMYGRKNFFDMRDFALKQSSVRPVWYYPETSYFISMDIDIPLLLTDYLVARSEDYKFVHDAGIKGHLNFTTGQELGYWLFDWQVALQTIPEYMGDPYAALKLLGEPIETWTRILEFQTKYFKNLQLISVLSSANLMDELPLAPYTHERVLIRDLIKKESHTRAHIALLEEALKELPLINEVKNEELKMLLNITHLRLQHALYLRKAVYNRNDKEQNYKWMAQAQRTRELAQAIMDEYLKKFNRYPEAKIFETFENPTSYSFGYGYPTKTLHYWLREELIAEKKIKSPFFLNLYDIRQILF